MSSPISKNTENMKSYYGLKNLRIVLILQLQRGHKSLINIANQNHLIWNMCTLKIE